MAKRQKKQERKPAADPHPCECGCGEQVTRRFRPGHDARLHGRLLKAYKAGDAEATAELKRLGWLRNES